VVEVIWRPPRRADEVFGMSRETNPAVLGRRAVLAGLFASVAVPALANAPKTSIFPQHRTKTARLAAAGSVDQIVEAAQLSGKTAFVVADAETGEILEARNPLLELPPASVTKAVTTLYALNELGPEHRFATSIVVTGPITNGKLDGDLYLVGGGDPTLDTDALGDLARQVKEAGLREISGKAYVHAGALPYQKVIDPEQPDYLGYNPSLSGLNLNYNRVFFEWKKAGAGYEVTMDARAIRYRPRVAMSTMAVVDRTAPLFTVTSKPDRDEWTVAARALGRKGGRWLPVRRPDIYAAEVFQTLCRSFGVVLPAFAPVNQLREGQVIAQWQSALLPDVLREMLKYSTNLTAEAVGVSASKARGGNPGSLKASGRMMTDWAKSALGAKHVKFEDHSGLGDDTRIAAGDMVRILVRAGWNGPLRHLMKEIPLSDEDGKPIKTGVKVEAKTGTLNFVSALAGYVETTKGRKLAFAIFSGDIPRRNAIPRAERERPKGARAWNGRAKRMQQDLIERWSVAFG
jgi:D-alanyl-D-alanine carboxypeptidase/D-alanyl-D-alanine-endopeptidase (penicillin-binding protein 4)